MNANILLLIHGVVEDTAPSNHATEYAELWAALQKRQPLLKDRINAVIPVEWGHAPLPIASTLLPDERLTAAENTIVAATNYATIKAHPTPDDSFLELTPDFLPRLILRPVLSRVKEQVLVGAIGDVLYYTSSEGERAVRDHVYTQFLTGMEPYKNAENVALHLIGHSPRRDDWL